MWQCRTRQQILEQNIRRVGCQVLAGGRRLLFVVIIQRAALYNWLMIGKLSAYQHRTIQYL